MGLLDKLKNATDMAKDAMEKSKEAAQAKKEAENARRAELLTLANQTSEAHIQGILNGFNEDDATFFNDLSKEELTKFTKEFFQKLLLPASNGGSSFVHMHPYINDKQIQSFAKNFSDFDTEQIPLLYIKDNEKQEFLLTEKNFYFKTALKEDKNYFSTGWMGCNHIHLLEIRNTNNLCTLLCNDYPLATIISTAKNTNDFVSLQHYFTCIKSKDFEITEQEIEKLIHSKIPEKIFEEIKKYEVDEEETILFVAYGVDSLTASDYIACTSSQIIINDREVMGVVSNVKQLYYEDITSMSISQGNSNDILGALIDAALAAAFKNCDLLIHSAGVTQKINTVSKIEAERIIEIYHEHRKEIRRQNRTVTLAAPVENTAKEPDIIEQIKKLAELKEIGILTEEEFSTKKAELLQRL